MPDQLDRIINSGKYGSLEVLTSDGTLTQVEACTLFKRTSLVIGNANRGLQNQGSQEIQSLTRALCGE